MCSIQMNALPKAADHKEGSGKLPNCPHIPEQDTQHESRLFATGTVP